MKKVINIFQATLITITILLLTLNITSLISLKVLKSDYPLFLNYTYFICKSESMEPTIEVDDIVIVKINDNIKEQDIITFKLGNSYITHRVVEVGTDSYVTKGDKNNTNDDVITNHQIVGKVVYILKDTTKIANILSNPVFIISIALLSTILYLLKQQKLHSRVFHT